MRKQLLIIGTVMLVLLAAVVSGCSNADDEERNIIRGKDDIYIWEDTYVIAHYSDGNHLNIATDGKEENILENVTDYKVKEDKLYIVSDEGYAVIDKECECRVYVTVPDDEFVSQYSEDEN